MILRSITPPIFIRDNRWSSAATAFRRIAILLIMLTAAEATLCAQSRAERRSRIAATQADDPFDAFRSIGDRNIFDPNRLPRVRRDSSTDAPAPADEVVTFVGTLQYEKGLFAFFDGSMPRYRTTVPVGGTIAGFSVTQVAPRSVSLATKERQLTLKMGESLSRREGTDWTVSTLPVPLSGPPTPSATPSSAPAPVAIPSDASATLRRLMEQRQKQLKE